MWQRLPVVMVAWRLCLSAPPSPAAEASEQKAESLTRGLRLLAWGGKGNPRLWACRLSCHLRPLRACPLLGGALIPSFFLIGQC